VAKSHLGGDGLLHGVVVVDQEESSQGAEESVRLLSVWCLWLERNVRVFDGRPSSPSALLGSLWSLVDTWCRAGFVLRSRLFAGIGV
jgi:hypothetical protein